MTPEGPQVPTSPPVVVSAARGFFCRPPHTPAPGTPGDTHGAPPPRSWPSPSCSPDAPGDTYPSPKAALEWGALPCPECRPMDPANPQESWKPLLDEIAADPLFAVKAGGLLERGISPDALARAYQDEFHLSFQDYLRMRRINHRFGCRFPHPQTPTHPTCASPPSGAPGESAASPTPGPLGASHPSGPPEPSDHTIPGGVITVQVCTPAPPEPSDHIITFSRLATPLGPMAAASTPRGIAMLEFAERRMLETQIRRLEERFSARVLPGISPWFPVLQDELNTYFAGRLREFSTPLDLRGSPFQMQVWRELRRIPFGQVRSYGEQARSMGNPAAVRAVGRANGENPLSILVPCHRVLGADGSMTGYGGRIWRKEALLRLESPQRELFQ